jgi:hypothetical protein
MVKKLISKAIPKLPEQRILVWGSWDQVKQLSLQHVMPLIQGWAKVLPAPCSQVI